MCHISELAIVSRRAKKLFTGSAFSAGTWGHQASAASALRVLQLERASLTCTSIKPYGRCRAIALAIACGVLGTSRARFVREAIRDYFTVFQEIENLDFLNDIKQAWALAEDIVQKDCKVIYVKGLLYNFIYLLINADGLLQLSTIGRITKVTVGSSQTDLALQISSLGLSYIPILYRSLES